MMKNIRIDRHGAVGVLSIARRDRFNSLDVETAQDLRKAGLQLARDREVRAVVLRGDGGVFCSGADLKYIARGGNEDVAYLSPDARPAQASYGPIFKQILEYIHSTISEIRRAPKPWIAAVDGAAAAGGLGIAMACDLVVAAERATFEWAYFKTGLTGAESTTFLLPRLVGLRKAMELVLLGPRLTAAEALAIGLINEVSADVDARALALAHQLHRLAGGGRRRQELAQPRVRHGAARRSPRRRARRARADRERGELRRGAEGVPRSPRAAIWSGVMHEYSIVAALIERVEREVQSRPGAEVRRLHVRIGELAGVDIELLRTAYETFRDSTICDRAELAIAPVPAVWRCRRCDRALVAGAILRCPGCGRAAQLAAGDEIILDRVEMEVRDV
jgi:2-(1,2-epoxy-1,2-dihydrophenyl)acetyl-CoA isomerase